MKCIPKPLGVLKAIVIAIILTSLSSMYGSSKLQDSLLSELRDQSNITPKSKTEIYLQLSQYFIDISKQDSAIYYAENAIKESQDHDLLEEEAKAYYSLGYAYDLFGNLKLAIDNYEIARIKYEVLDLKEDVASCMNAKGAASYFKGDYELALEFFIKCLEYVELHEINDVMANTLNNLGVIYRVTAKNKEAILTYHKTLRLSKKIGNQNMVGTSYHNLGVAYNFESNLDTALIYFDSAAQYYQSIDDDFEVGRIKTAIGEAYYLNKKPYSEARKFLKEGEAYFLKGNIDQEVLSKTYLLLAQLERDDNNYIQSKNYFNKGLKLIEDTERTELQLDYYNEMEVFYNKYDELDLAHLYLKKYVTLYKEVQTNEKLKAIEELQTQYETKEKEQEIIALNSKNELQRNILRVRKNGLLAFGFGSTLLLILVIALIRLYRKIRDQNVVIETALIEKDTLLREIHHRVKNNLQVISALLTLQSKHVKDDTAFEALKEGQGRVQSMALIHQNLYQHDNLKGVNTKDYFEKLIENIVDSYKTDDRNIELHSDIESMILDVETMIPLGLVVNELTSNALKHAFSISNTKGNITIALKEVNNQLQLSVKDDGKGAEVFQLENKSFGFSLIRSFARRLDAQVNIENNKGLSVELLIDNYQKAA